jgi:hypothetical protein
VFTLSSVRGGVAGAVAAGSAVGALPAGSCAIAPETHSITTRLAIQASGCQVLIIQHCIVLVSQSRRLMPTLDHAADSFSNKSRARSIHVTYVRTEWAKQTPIGHADPRGSPLCDGRVAEWNE